MSNTSTLAFRSNLYPVINGCQTDRAFQSKIHDPFSLVALKKKAKLTDIQEQEYQAASLPCAYAEKDDYPWGTVLDEVGHERVVCKCLNTECKLFRHCRPDFDESELAVREENKLAQPSIFKFDEKSHCMDTANNGDTETAEKLFEQQVPDAEPYEDNGELEELQATDNTNFFVIQNPLPAVSHTIEMLEVSTNAPPPMKNTEVGFHSFIESVQEDIIEAEPSARGIVNAGPGTGKTWTLIEKIIYMINNETASPENILVLCFSRAAVEVIKLRLTAAAELGRVGYEWRDVDVRTFDSFSTYMLAEVQDTYPELLPQHFQLEAHDYDARIRVATSVLRKKLDMMADYEHIIVDEVQDLVCERAELVLALLKGLPNTCGFTVLGDSCQSLYDYIAADDPNSMSSARFYQEIFKCFPNANFYSLTENHRQGDRLELLSSPYRTAILTGTIQERTNIAASLVTDIPQVPSKLQKFNKLEANQYVKQGTLGILTRTNGQALQISAWLRNEEVPHQLQRAIGAPTLGDWISKLFCSYENETIDEGAFVTRHLTLFPSISHDIARARWAALVGAQYGEAKNRYEVADLLRGLLRNIREPVLYQSNDDQQYAITVSSIHRAKGKEFDSVIVIDDVIEAMADPEINDILEHKVCYVALTRPKKRIERAGMSKRDKQIYITRNADKSKRCAKASGGVKGRLYISHFEVGCDNDLNVRTFGNCGEVQEFIQHKVVPGMPLKLIRCPEKTNPYVTYRVVMEENENFVLGYTSKMFAVELEKAIQHILKMSCSVFFQVFPHAFCDVYVDEITTCISTRHPLPTAAKTFGDIGIWTGITITGFASVDKDTY